ncbi:hypothetical protein LMIY3S_02717 [Labrys miyagiensis]
MKKAAASGDVVDLYLAVDASASRLSKERIAEYRSVVPLVEEHVQALVRVLRMAPDAHAAEVLNEALGMCVCLLLATTTFTTPAQAAEEEERRAEFARLARDPARALTSDPVGSGGRRARDIALALAEQTDIDPTTCVGAAALGDLATDVLKRREPRAGSERREAEQMVFDYLVATIAQLAPEALRSLPANEAAEYEACAAIEFTEEFLVHIVNRATSSIPASDDRIQWLNSLKNKHPRNLLDGIRAARKHERDYIEQRLQEISDTAAR